MIEDKEEPSVQEDEDIDENETYDNLSSHSCISCGARLTKAEHEEFEDQCHDCIWAETYGIIDDNPNEEVDPDD